MSMILNQDKKAKIMKKLKKKKMVINLLGKLKEINIKKVFIKRQ